MNKVLVALTYFRPNISGITIYADRIAEEMQKKGHPVSILTTQHQPDQKRTEQVDGLNIVRVPVTFFLGKGPIMLSYPWHAWKAVQQADVVNAHLPQFEVSVLAIITKLQGKRLILTHHTDLSDWPGILNKLSKFATHLSQLVAGFLADTIVVYTEDYSKHSYFARRFPHKWVVTYPPVRLPETEKAIPQMQTKPENELWIGFSGRIAKQKGLPHLLQAIPILEENLEKTFKIFLAGPDKEVIGENYREELTELITKYEDRIVFVGSIAPDDMRSFYEKLDVLVLPSDDRLESFGFVQVEAMLCGVPVVASNLPGMRVPIQVTGMGELVAPGDPKQLATTIISVLQNKAKYDKTHEEIRTIFGYERTINTYARLFEQRI